MSGQPDTARPPTGAQTPFVQPTDPGFVGPGRIWVDTSSNPPTLKIRNTADTGWASQGGGSQPLTGDGDPNVGNVSAAFVGQQYNDTTNGAAYFAQQTGTGHWSLYAGAGLY